LKRFVVLYSSPVGAREQMANASSEEASTGMQAWMEWAQRAGDAIVDLGTPVEASSRVSAAGTSASDSQTSGYSLLQGDSNETIITLLRDHPHLKMPGASIDVLEALPVPGS
jgi:hypothetical protein